MSRHHFPRTQTNLWSMMLVACMRQRACRTSTWDTLDRPRIPTFLRTSSLAQTKGNLARQPWLPMRARQAPTRREAPRTYLPCKRMIHRRRHLPRLRRRFHHRSMPSTSPVYPRARKDPVPCSPQATGTGNTRGEWSDRNRFPRCPCLGHTLPPQAPKRSKSQRRLIQK